MPPVEIPSTRSTSALQRAFVACVICLAVFQFSENTADPDLWGHVLYGEHLLQTGHLMRTDPYSWTAFGHEWTNHEIVAEAALAVSFRALGGSGLLLLKLATGLLTLAIALGTAASGRDHKTRMVAWTLAALAVVEISFGFAARPQIFTALALAAELWALRQVHLGKWVWALALPPMFALWINTHGGVVVGMVLLFAAAGAATVQGLVKKLAPHFIGARIEAGPPRRIISWLWFSAILSALALLANPYGFQLLRWLAGSVLWLRPEIDEWNPPAFGWDHAAFFGCLVLVAPAICLSRRRWQLWEAAAIILLGALALRAVRNTPLFCIAALALLPAHLAGVLEAREGDLQRLADLGRRLAGWRFSAALIWLISAGIIAATFTLHKQRAWTMEVPRDEYPVSAVQFIQQHHLHGNLLVYFDWGEMCLWELPDSRVSIDGRLDTCYPAGVIAAHWSFYRAEPFSREALDLGKADFALLRSKLPGSLALAQEDGWEPVYYDNLAVVLVKKVNQFPGLSGANLPVIGNLDATKGRAAFPGRLPVQ